MKKTLLLLCILAITNCSGHSNNSYTEIDVAVYAKRNDIPITVQQFELDIPFADDAIGLVNHDTLFVLHQSSSKVYAISESGTILNIFLGYGQGPKELPIKNAMFFVKVQDEYIIIGGSADIYHFDLGFNRKKTSIYSWNSNYPDSYLEKNSKPEVPKSYNLAYGSRVVLPHNNTLLIPLSMEDPFRTFNQFEDLYIKEGRVIGVLDLKEAEISRIFGKVSPHYYRGEMPRLFLSPLIGKLSSDEIVISSFGDSLMHVFTMEGKHLRSFGVKGDGLKDDYRSYIKSKNVNTFMEYGNKLVSNYGFYFNLKAFEDNKTIFRTYLKNGRSKKSAHLQIFQEYALIATIPVESDFFTISGKIGDSYISAPYYDENKGAMFIKKLTISKE